MRKEKSSSLSARSAISDTLTWMTPCGPAAALTDGVGSPGLAPEEAARVCCSNVDEVEDEDAVEFCNAVADWSLPARLLASLRARSSVWDIVTEIQMVKKRGRTESFFPERSRFGSPTSSFFFEF